jgi:hypothetical protein
MAFKRKSRKTGPISRRTTTYNDKTGKFTDSTSVSGSGNTRYTTTSQGGKTYTTRTTRFANGFVERKRISSSASKKNTKPASKSKRKPQSAASKKLETVLMVVFALIFFVVFVAFSG